LYLVIARLWERGPHSLIETLSSRFISRVGRWSGPLSHALPTALDQQSTACSWPQKLARRLHHLSSVACSIPVPRPHRKSCNAGPDPKRRMPPLTSHPANTRDPNSPPHNPPLQDAQSRLLPCVHETILPLELHVPCPLPHTAAPRSFPLRCLSGSFPRLWLAINNTYKTAEAVPRQGTVRQKVLRK